MLSRGDTYDGWNAIRESLSDVFAGKKLKYSFQFLAHWQAHFSGKNRREYKVHFDQFLADQARALRVLFSSFSSPDSLQRCVETWEEFGSHVTLCCTIFPQFTKDFRGASRVLIEDILADKRLRLKFKKWIGVSLRDKRFDAVKRFALLLTENDSGHLMDGLIGVPFVEHFKQKFYEFALEKSKVFEVPQFAGWIRDCLREERNLWQCGDTDSIFNKYVTQSFVDGTMAPFIKYLTKSPTGCEAMILNSDFENLTTLTSCLTELECSHIFKESFSGALKEKVESALFFLDSDPLKAVEMTVEAITKSAQLFNFSVFDVSAKVFFSGLNKRGFAEALSLYYDRSVKLMRVDEIRIKNLKVLFEMIDDEDGVDRALRTYMSLRLIHAERIHLEVERAFLAAIPTERAAAFERWISDVERSWCISSQFNALHDSHMFDFRATILRGPSLLTAVGSPPRLPPYMLDCASKFEQFYSSLHNGRRIVFLLGFGKVKFLLSHKGIQYTLTAPTPYINTILMFNEDKRYSLEDATAESTLDVSSTKLQLQKLIHTGLVREENERYGFNEAFTSPEAEIIIGGPSKAKGENHVSSPNLRNSEQFCSTFVDTTVVRLLKETSPRSFQSLFDDLNACALNRYSVSKVQFKNSLQGLVERNLVTSTSEGYLFRP